MSAALTLSQIQEALKPLWQYAGGLSLAAAAESMINRRYMVRPPNACQHN